MLASGGVTLPYASRCLNPSFWMEDDLRRQIQEVLAFLTEDRWEFYFSQAVKETHQITLEVDEQSVLGSPDTVVLFSGGADSLCTTIEAVARHDNRPVLISHRPAPHISARQKRLTAELRERFAHWGLPHLSFWIHRRGSDAADTSQRSRAFLFASLGAAVAVELGISKVLLGDNGIVSLNLPISAQLVGTLASRSTHPKFLHLFNELLTAVFPNRIKVVNPLWKRTRAETLKVLKVTGGSDLLQETHSCSRAHRRPAATPHCGYCSQCVDRRFGSLAAGLEEHDRAERYEVDIFTGSLHEGEPRTVTESYVRFARQVHETDVEALFHQFPQLYDCIVPTGKSPEQMALALTSMLKRHATSVLDVIAMMISRHDYDLAANLLPDDCLLRLVTGSPYRAERAPAPDEYVFRREGEIWTVSYLGLPCSFKHAKGLMYIARLLAHPGVEFHALDLHQGRQPHEGPFDDRRLLSLVSEMTASDGLSIDRSNSGTEVLDARARREFREEVKRLRNEHAELQAAGDRSRIPAIEEEIQFLERELKAATGLGGRSRVFATAAERARKAVYRSIQNSLRNIATFHPRLYEHLDGSITTGTYCSYRHSPAPDWKI